VPRWPVTAIAILDEEQQGCTTARVGGFRDNDKRQTVAGGGDRLGLTRGHEALRRSRGVHLFNRGETIRVSSGPGVEASSGAALCFFFFNRSSPRSSDHTRSSADLWWSGRPQAWSAACQGLSW
jgi:hypothetical protein